jgi:two-component system, LytTR family, response regulator
MLHCIIIDDEQKGIDALNILIARFIEDVKVVAETRDSGEAVSLINNYRPEIVFLDIQMPGMDGFELLEKLTWKNFYLVFTTAHQEYGLRALKSNASDYLLKPIDLEDLSFSINKIKKLVALSSIPLFDNQALISIFQQHPKNKLLLHSKSGIESVDTSDIVCLESRSNYTCVHLADARSIVISRTLKEFEGQLCMEHPYFMRVHHSFIINSNKIQRFIKGDDLIIMANDQKVPLAKSRRASFLEWLDL